MIQVTILKPLVSLIKYVEALSLYLPYICACLHIGVVNVPHPSLLLNPSLSSRYDMQVVGRFPFAATGGPVTVQAKKSEWENARLLYLFISYVS